MSFSYNAEKDTVTHVNDGISLFPDDGILKQRTYVFFQKKGMFGMKNMCKETRSHYSEQGPEHITRQETYPAYLAWREVKKYRKQMLKTLGEKVSQSASS